MGLGKWIAALDILAFSATFVTNDRFLHETLPSVGNRDPLFMSGDMSDGIKNHPCVPGGLQAES